MDAGRPELAFLSIAEAARRLFAREISPLEIVQACLNRIKARDGELNTFITVLGVTAQEEAVRAGEEIAAGKWRGPLHGIPIAVKDLIDVAGVRNTAASNLFTHNVSARDAFVIERLREAGAIIIGKTNLHEFAYGCSSVVGAFGPVRNPHDPARIAGGSSSGSAAAVESGMCLGALGTDTAGSIRQPASFCGVVGLKPTHGLVSTAGVFPLAWTYDHVGPITRTAEDAELILSAIRGYDPADPLSRDFARRISSNVDPSWVRVGIVREHFFTDLDPGVAAAIESAIASLRPHVREVRDIAIPVLPDRTVHAAEAWAAHAEFVAQSPELYQPETLRRIRAGAAISTAEYIARLREVQQARHQISRVFKQVDVLLTPTVPVPPPTIDGMLAAGDDLRARELVLLRNTRPFNVLGIPAISVPCGRDSNGLPVGLQIAAAAGREDLVVSAARLLDPRESTDSC